MSPSLLFAAYRRTKHILSRPPNQARMAFAVLGLAVLSSVASIHGALADTLGGRMQAISTDLSNGFGYALTAGGYVLGGVALLTGFYVLWKHQQNANGPHKLGYGIASIVIGGAFLSITYLAGFATHTVSDAGPDNTGSAAAMRFDN